MLGDDLQYFLALAATGTFTGTAEHLGISQPALSKAIQRLERRVGARMVTRTARGIELTEAGKAFHARLSAASRDMEDAVQEARNLGGNDAGLLRMGVTPATTDFVLQALLPALTVERPAASIAFTTAFSNAMMEKISRRDVELAVCPVPERLDATLECETLYEDPCSLMMQRSHPLARQDTISLEDITRYPWAATGLHEFTRLQVRSAFSRRGLALPRIVVEADTLDALSLVVARTGLISMINRRNVEAGSLPDNIVVRPLALAGMDRRIGILRRAAYLSPIGQRAVELLRAAAAAQRQAAPSQGAA
jgi:DNA-binding transcriptional LysR family regulator